MTQKNNSNSEARFRQFSTLTIAVVFILILLGGIVRSSGSGMGCPDWPKCFGQFIPPTNVSELPANYKEHYAEIRLQKNIRFAKVVNALGYPDFANEILNNPEVYVEADFNAFHTWVEYINRLFGVLTGFFIIITLVFSFRAFAWKSPFYFSLFAFIIVLIQGLVGAFVVSSNLAPGIITVHLLLALVIIGLLIQSRLSSSIIKPVLIKPNLFFLFISFLAIVVIVVQIIWGTQVRESVDRVAKILGEANRNDWLKEIGSVFSRHKGFSSIVGFVIIGLSYLILAYPYSIAIKRAGISLLILTFMQFVSGISLGYFNLPAIAQTLHIFLACIMFGLTYFIFALSYRNRLSPTTPVNEQHID